MCCFDVDRTGFPLVADEDDEIFFHFFPITRVQFEEAVALGWLLEDKHLGMGEEAAAEMVHRGEVFFPGLLGIARDTPEHALPIEAMLFPGGYKTLKQQVRNGLQEIEGANIYSFYLTNLKQREFASLIHWLEGDGFRGDMLTHNTYEKCYFKFLQFPVGDLIAEILKLEGLNPRARKMLELFSRYKGIINGLPGNIFEMTGNYKKRDSEEISRFSWQKNEPVPGADSDGYPLYNPVIVGRSALWPYIPVPGRVRHLKVECHPLVGSRGVYRKERK